MLRRVTRTVQGFFGFVVLLIIWQTVVFVAKPPDVVLPSALTTAEVLGGLLISSALWSDIAVSLFRVLAGFAAAVVIGVPLGAGMARSAFFRAFLEPTTSALRFVIPFAWIPLATFWFGLSEAGKIFITWYAAVFVIMFQTEAGFRYVDTRLIKAARTLGASPRRMFLSVLLPGATPYIVTGLRLGLALAWVSLLAAELVSATSGIGFFILNAADLFMTERVISGMAIIGVIGFMLDFVFQVAERKMFPWYKVGA